MEALGTEVPGVVGVPGSVSADGGRDGELDGVRVCGSGGSLAQVTVPSLTPLDRKARVVSQTNAVDDVEEGGLAPLALDTQIVSSQLQVLNRRVRNCRVRNRVYAVDPGVRVHNTILYLAVMNK